MWFLPDVTKRPIKPFNAYDIFNELYRPMKIPVDKVYYMSWPGSVPITPFFIITNLGI
jgi:hypothetical protein